jgi:hypothetical protein
MSNQSQPETLKTHSRRALLASALGGLGAWVASAVGRASPVRGADGTFDNVYATHVVSSNNSGNTGVSAFSSVYYGVLGQSTSSRGVYGISTSGSGVFGQSFATGGDVAGVYGYAPDRFGVYGRSETDVGTRGLSVDGLGMYAQSEHNDGILGVALSASRGVHGESAGGSGLYGFSGPYATGPATKAKTGVYGYANQDATANGVVGESAKGYAGYFIGKVYTTTFHEMKEISTPAAPAADKARLFVRDNGSGKTQLCVRFNSGGVKVLATQP